MNQLDILMMLYEKTTGRSITLKADTTFEEMKTDDFEIVDFLMSVEEYYGFAFQQDEMLNVRSIQDVMNMIDKSMQED